MLQTNMSQLPSSYEDQRPSFDPWYYYGILKKRFLFLLIPALLVTAVGSTIVMLRPVTYVSHGTILIDSPQIPTDLVRPTVTGTAAARIQVIEQRVMTRDNILAIVKKFNVFANHKNWHGGLAQLTSTEMLDLMRQRTSIRSQKVDLPGSRASTISFTVSFEHEQPETARQVANELMTLILAEDARVRSNRAADTVKFLAREQARLESAVGKVEEQITEIRLKARDSVPQKLLADLAMMRIDYQEKASLYAESHPTLQALKKRISTLEGMTSQSSEADIRVDVLSRQSAALQRDLVDNSDKLAIARRGETLERDQQSERLEVIEQPVQPSAPVKGKRMKSLAMVFFAAFGFGAGAIFVAETLDRTIRRSTDLARMVDPHLIVGIPYIATKAEARRNKRLVRLTAQAFTMLFVIGLGAVHFWWMPLDQLLDKLLLRSLS